ncbi:DEAD/DEAH box helicase [Ruminiclostridium cellobioparum]|uniref:DEAD/DEAH box helicase n=1 Tax=Ruminiclostridium cellobioparum TaxID=29355 RepID=UPI0028AD1007|nr:DEAD/DEAH box helicase [Ruminiclostridium cellobioparum]
MENSFNNLGIIPPILKALDEMGFQTPTEVQSRGIPHILNKEDLIVMSKTGSGKTAVFGVSMLQLTDPAAAVPQGLILAPVRELAVQVDSDIKKMAKHLSHKTTAVYGQHNMTTEVQALKKGVTIVTGTPGRVFDHIQQGNLITKNIRFLVLDEADRMLDMGFLDQVKRIIRSLPKDRVTLLFSATMPPEIHRICSEYMKNPVTIEIESQTKTVDSIQQEYYRVLPNEKRTQLNRLLLVEQPESCMIFCNTRIAVDHVQGFLTKQGYASEALHGDIPQGKRTKTIQQFKQGEFHILVATDVAARGIHIDNLSLVINYDVPVEKDSYVHRIGRTGRAGNGGKAVSMVTSDDIMTLYEIEEHIGAMIPEADLPSEELLNRRKAEAADWLAANALKEKPAKTPRLSAGTADKGSRRSSGQSRSPKTGERQKSPAEGKPRNNQKVRENNISRTKSKDSGEEKSPAIHNSPASAAAPNRQKIRTGPDARTVKKETGKEGLGEVKAKPSNHKSGVERKPNSGRDRFDRRDYVRSAGTENGQAVGKNTAAAPAAVTAAKKKPFLKRLLASILGK